MGAFEKLRPPPFNKYCTCCRINNVVKRERIWKGVAKKDQPRFRFCPVCDLNQRPTPPPPPTDAEPPTS